MPIFICPNCGDRSISTERTAGFQDRARACAKCGFGFLLELLDDYYPAPNAAFFLLDQNLTPEEDITGDKDYWNPVLIYGLSIPIAPWPGGSR